jgi:uncharacterized protein YktA (UPF0223 family)
MNEIMEMYHGSLNESELMEDFEVLRNLSCCKSEARASFKQYIELMEEGYSDIDAFQKVAKSLEAQNA